MPILRAQAGLTATSMPVKPQFLAKIANSGSFYDFTSVALSCTKKSYVHKNASLTGLRTFYWKPSDGERMPGGTSSKQIYTDKFLKQAKSATADRLKCHR